MKGGKLAEMMVVAMDPLMSARDGSAGLDKAIETIVDTSSRFNGRDIMGYLEAFKA